MKNSVPLAVISAVILELGICLWLVPVCTGQEFGTISPDELKMTSEPRAPGAPAIILQRRVDRDDNRPSHEDNYLRIKVLTEEGRKYANVEIIFYQGIGDVLNIRARTIRPDGSTVNFDGNVYEKYVARGRGVKLLAKTFTFQDVQVGSILEYSYTADPKGFLYDSHWILNSDLFTKHAQFSLRPLQSSQTPMSLSQILKGVPSEAVPRTGPDQVIRMEVDNIPAFQTEDYMPPENELKARVDFTYKDNFGERDPDRFWKNVGKRGNDGLEFFFRKRKTIGQALGTIVSPNDPPEEKLRKIYARVQGLRNTSYEVEKTEKEEKRNREKLAESVDEVWKHGYGNAVELTWLFLGFARAAGFEAYGCWVADRSEYFFNPMLMQSAALRDNVVLVKINGKEMYVDPGTAIAPFGLLPWNETATPGLRLDGNGGTWIRTPLPDSAESQIQLTAQFKLSEAGTLEGKVTATYTGLEAMYRRLEARHDDEVGRKGHLEELVKRRMSVPAEVELTKKPEWSTSENPLVAEFAVKVPNWASNTGRRMLVPVGIFAAGERHLFESPDRIHPVYFAYPYSERDDLTIELPPGWHATSVPEPRTQKGYSVVFGMNVEDHQKTLHITRQLDIDIFVLEQTRYAALRRFFQLMRSSDEEQIVLQLASPHDPAGSMN